MLNGEPGKCAVATCGAPLPEVPVRLRADLTFGQETEHFHFAICNLHPDLGVAVMTSDPRPFLSSPIPPTSKES